MKLGIGLKMAGGFGILIAISIALGSLAIFNMEGVKKESVKLVKDFIPEVKVANSVERNSFKTMYEIRGYTFTQSNEYLDKGKENLKSVNTSLSDALSLASKSSNLAELDKNSKKAKEFVDSYGKQVEALIEINKSIDDCQEAMNANAKSAVDNVNAYLNDQDKLIQEEISQNTPADKLKDRVLKIKMMNDVVDLCNNARISVWKGMCNRDRDSIKAGIEKLASVDGSCNELLKISKRQSNIDQLNKIKSASLEYKSVAERFLKLWDEKVAMDKERTRTGDLVLAACAETADAGMKCTVDVAQNAESALGMSSKIMIVGLAIAFIIGVLFAWIITSSVLKPVNRAAEIANTLASQSEELSTVSSGLLSASEQMSAQSNNVSAATEQMSANINAMATAAEEMNVNAQSVAGASEQMSRNVANVAGAIEELSASMDTVGEKANGGSQVAAGATATAKSASETMNALGAAAQEIGQVTEVIKRIAEQTNLLALNATIEAASAGDAGKGFAVVANEIKELANQSAQAAEDIAKRIRGVQGRTDEAVKAIAEVSSVILKLNEAAESISELVAEQAKATTDMASNVSQANTGVNNIASSIKEVAEGTKEMSRNAGEAAKGANDVSSNISEVKSASASTSSNATQVNASAGDLSRLAGELKQVVAEIKGT